MPKSHERTQFGGPSEIYPEDYPSAPRYVNFSANEHDRRNEHHIRYSGLGDGVAYRQKIPDSALREMTYNASQDKRDVHEELYPPPTEDASKGAKRRYEKQYPYAMGAYSTEGTLRRDADLADDASNTRHGRQIYLSSSATHANGGHGCAMKLPSTLHDELDLPDEHRTGWHCAEQGMVSDHRYANARTLDGGGDRVFVVNPHGEHMAPCGHDTAKYGCADFCRAVDAADIGDYGERHDGEDDLDLGSDDDGSDNDGNEQRGGPYRDADGNIVDDDGESSGSDEDSEDDGSESKEDGGKVIDAQEGGAVDDEESSGSDEDSEDDRSDSDEEEEDGNNVDDQDVEDDNDGAVQHKVSDDEESSSDEDSSDSDADGSDSDEDGGDTQDVDVEDDYDEDEYD